MMSPLAIHAQPPLFNRPEEVADWLQTASSNCAVVWTAEGLQVTRRGTAKTAAKVPLSVISLTEAAFPSAFEELARRLRANPPDTVAFRLATPPWDRFALPMDLMAQALLKELPSEPPPSLLLVPPSEPWWRDVATLWNLRAIVGLFAGDIRDRRQARHAFLQTFCEGNALHVAECLRQRERCFMTAAVLAGAPRHPMPSSPSEVFTRMALENMAARLEQVRQPNVYVQREAELFQNVYLPVLQELRENIRILAPNRPPSPFVTLHGGTPPVKSAVSLTMDAERLCLRLEAEEPHMAKRKLAFARRDEPIWEDDSFEIHLLCDGTDEPEEGWQFIVNGNGALWDGRRLKTHADATWNAVGAHAEASITSAGWAVTVTIPWKALGLSGPPATPCRANFYRTRFAGGAAECMAWSPIRVNNYFYPKDFGWITWQ